MILPSWWLDKKIVLSSSLSLNKKAFINLSIGNCWLNQNHLEKHCPKTMNCFSSIAYLLYYVLSTELSSGICQQAGDCKYVERILCVDTRIHTYYRSFAVIGGWASCSVFLTFSFIAQEMERTVQTLPFWGRVSIKGILYRNCS